MIPEGILCPFLQLILTLILFIDYYLHLVHSKASACVNQLCGLQVRTHNNCIIYSASASLDKDGPLVVRSGSFCLLQFSAGLVFHIIAKYPFFITCHNLLHLANCTQKYWVDHNQHQLMSTIMRIIQQDIPWHKTLEATFDTFNYLQYHLHKLYIFVSHFYLS